MNTCRFILSLLLCGYTMAISNAFAQSEPISIQNGLPKLRIIYPKHEKSALAHSQYFPKLLELALQKTQNEGNDFELEQSQESFTSNRLMAELMHDKGHITVMWTSTSKVREQELLPIKISIVRGLNSYRIFLIRKEDQELFHRIRNLADLSKLRAGQGAQWPDTAVMLSNGLPVIGAAQSDLLFDMLVSKRFEYFPRGLYEIWGEQQYSANKGLAIEDSLMLHYPAPIYFFVNKKNTALAERLERGLRIAMQDGSFEKLFFDIPGFKRGYDELQRSSRLIINLDTDFPAED